MVFDGQISLEKGKKYVIPGEPFSQMPEHSGAVRCRRQWCYLKLPTSLPTQHNKQQGCTSAICCAA